MKIKQIVPNEHENKDKTLFIYFLQLRNFKKKKFLKFCFYFKRNKR